MATRATYRASLILKLRDAANNLGKTMFTTTELNEMLANAPRRLFPHLYKKTSASITSSSGGLAVVTDGDLIHSIYNSDGEYITGWYPMGTTSIYGLPASGSFTAFYIAPHTMPADDVTDAGIPDWAYDLVILAAGVDGLERWSADRIDHKGYQPQTESGVDENEILNAHAQWSDTLRNELDSKGLNLPAMGA